MQFPNRTKIVATIGPASREPDIVHDLIRSGVDVFRLNAAHSDHPTLVRDIRTIRRVAKQLRENVGVLVDLQGPKIRVGPFHNAEPIWLQRGQTLAITTEPGFVGRAGENGTTRIGTIYPGLAGDVRIGERVLLDDGNIELRVQAIEGNEMTMRVVYGGLLKQFKGINLPGSSVSANSLCDKDVADLHVALENGADFIAQSFVRSAEDVLRLKRLIQDAGSDAHVIAKIERPEAVRHLASILRAADALMVARGDMGVELGPELVPSIQKRIIRMCNESGKPVITATQMLESMITNPRPTRAEASDVANAIYDGTSAVMLSAETASGRHPIRAVRFMDRIVRQTESDVFSHWEYQRRRRSGVRGKRGAQPSISHATVRAAAYGAIESGAAVIAVFTESGSTAQLMATERIPTHLVAFTPHQRTMQRLTLSWGVVARRLTHARTSHEMTLQGERMLLDSGLAKVGDRVVVVFGSSRTSGMTNIMSIRTLAAPERARPASGKKAKTPPTEQPAVGH